MDECSEQVCRQAAFPTFQQRTDGVCRVREHNYRAYVHRVVVALVQCKGMLWLPTTRLDDGVHCDAAQV